MVHDNKRMTAARPGLAAMGLGLAAALLTLGTAAQAADGTSEADKIANGREIFDSAACSACHTLADAGASGSVGPSLDHNPNLTKAFIVNRVTNGQAGMPPFAGQLSDEEIADVADYVMKATAK